MKSHSKVYKLNYGILLHKQTWILVMKSEIPLSFFNHNHSHEFCELICLRLQFDNQAKINPIVIWFEENQFEIKIF